MKKLVIIIGTIIGATIILLFSYQIISYIIDNSAKNYNNNIVSENTIQNNKNKENELFYQNDNGTNRTIDKVTMKIKPGTLTRTGAVIMITDENIPPYTYEEWFRIDEKNDDEWQEETKIVDENGWLNYTHTEQTIFTGEDGTLELETDWSTLYGELKNGEYRLVKKIEDQYVYINFNIE